MEATLVPIIRGMEKEDVVHKNNGILSAIKKNEIMQQHLQQHGWT